MTLEDQAEHVPNEVCQLCGGTVIHYAPVGGELRGECERCGFGWTNGIPDPPPTAEELREIQAGPRGDAIPPPAPAREPRHEVPGCPCSPRDPISSECLWEILHAGPGRPEHHAWYQRALLKGDFRSGLVPSAAYVVDAEGRAADRAVPPRCATCDRVPDVDDLEPVYVATGERGVLDVYRLPERDPRRRPWPRPSDAMRCFWCQVPLEQTGPLLETGLCVKCTGHLVDTSAPREPEPPEEPPSEEPEPPKEEPPAEEPPPVQLPDAVPDRENKAKKDKQEGAV